MEQAIVNGLVTGGMYAAFGIGLSLIYGVTRVISAVHAVYIVLGALIANSVWTTWGIDPFLLLPVLACVGFIAGYGLQRSVVNRAMHSGTVMTITSTFGLELIFVTVLLLIWGPNLVNVRVPYASDGIDIGSARVPLVRVAILLLSILLAVGLDLILRRTELGRRIRAVSQDRMAFDLVGLDGSHYYAMAHGLAAGVACAAGVFVVMTQPVEPFIGMPILMVAFAVVVLAGFGSVTPVLVAGILLALTENFAGLIIGLQYQRLSLFAAYLLVATLRPNGLFGKRFYAH
jgi:branched-chain amino acid transport system permease protein